jgi:uncharacterized RDD family membrane protein YckC
MAAFVYEGVLLFGVLVLADYLFATLTQQRHALYLREIGMAFIFVVLAIYFSWFWSHSGQTLAMKTWRVRLVARDGAPVSQGRALLRFLCAWVWFLPPLALAALLGVKALGGGGVMLLLLGWIGSYALSALMQREHQFWHDLLCGTRLVHVLPADGAR